MLTLSILLGCIGGPSNAEGPPIERRSPPERPPLAGGAGWSHTTVRDGARREAVCNDGQPATFFVRPGSGDGKASWVVFLEGGGLCSSIEECNRRPAVRRSPAPAKRPVPSTGILSTDAASNPDFHDWNAAFLPYCSSDFWLGDRAASEATGGFAFRGARIVDAIVEDLKAGVDGMPPLQGADTLLMVGGSAGSMGVRHHVDHVAASLQGTRVLGVADSGFEPWKQAKLPSPEDARIADELRLWKPRLDASCVQAVGIERCLEQASALDHVQAPLFVYMDQFDTNAYTRANIPNRECDEATRFSRAVREGLERFDGSFSTRAGIHVLTIKDNFSDLAVVDPETKGRYTFADVLGNWVFDRPGPKHVAAGAR